MSRLVTIAIFNFSHEAQVLITKLNSEGIESFLKDELTLQAQPFISTALGGVKLQVREENIGKVSLILNEMGIPLLEYSQKLSYESNFLNSFFGKIPFVKNWVKELQYFSFFGIVLCVIALIIAFSFPNNESNYLQARDREIEFRKLDELKNVHFARIETLLKNDKFEALEYALNLYQSDYKQNHDLAGQIGYLYMELDSMVTAKNYLEYAVGISFPNSVDLFNLAVVKLRNGDYESGILLMTKACDQDWQYCRDLALVYEEKNDLKSALREYFNYAAGLNTLETENMWSKTRYDIKTEKQWTKDKIDILKSKI